MNEANGDRHIGEMRDVPQVPYDAGDFDDRPRLWISAAILPAHEALAADQRHKAWSEWRAGETCQELIQDVAAGELEVGSAMEAAFLAGIEAAGRS